MSLKFMYIRVSFWWGYLGLAHFLKDSLRLFLSKSTKWWCHSLSWLLRMKLVWCFLRCQRRVMFLPYLILVKCLGFCQKLTALLFNYFLSWLADLTLFLNISACFLFHLLFLRYLWLSVFLWMCVFRRFFCRISYNFSSLDLLRIWNVMICRTFFS